MNAINLTMGACEQKVLMSGLHVVCDVFCKNCTSNVGWKYVKFLYLI